jgi:hypothetical protein
MGDYLRATDRAGIADIARSFRHNLVADAGMLLMHGTWRDLG